MVPASTMKVLTALAALETWGRGHRFETDFYLDDSGWLWVKGLADPYLVSEELSRIAQGLKSKGVREVKGIGLDDSFFAPDVEIAGRSSSDNPYDAPVTALAANFNTVSVVRSGSTVSSAEPQTPLTATARRLGSEGSAGKKRVNLQQRSLAVGYFGEILAAKLRDAGIRVGEDQRNAPVPRGAKRVYRHQNSRTLAEVLAPTLEYSNNFVANALFLHLASPDGKGQVSMAAAQRAMTEFARRRFGWRDFTVQDGAGLSRGNRLSARQLVEVMEAFAPYRDLMPAQDGNSAVRAKTGTLRGVSCYAGYVRRGGSWEPFALMINEPVDYNLRLRVASALVR
jgi:D-alanyl-D-alanine carboxypeptidase/D-alanyl-D-alanine-endopeptidase (penicillin-binding protein 4)